MNLKMIWTTCSYDESTSLVRSLLEKRLIGCANIFEPHTALYWWNGEICEDKEVTIIMETNENLVHKTISELTKRHSYDTPKIMVFTPESVPKPFQKWLNKEVDMETHMDIDGNV